jgi:uncharacterized protein YcnI
VMRVRRSRRTSARHAPARWWVRTAVVAGVLVTAAPATAHVVVLPATAPVGRSTEFTLQVPTERAIPTTAVRVMFPSDVTVYSFKSPTPGFTVTPIHARNQSIIGVIYRGTVPVGRYATFQFLGTPFTSGQTLWPSYQTYADGEVKPWTGPPDSPGSVSPESGPTQPGPAAHVEIVSIGASAMPGSGSSGSGSEAGIWLGVIAICIAGGAAIATGFLWASRPARLPDDETTDTTR